MLIRFVLSNFGVKQTVFSNVDQFKSNVEKIVFKKEILDGSKVATKLTLELLMKELGLSSCQPIPSQIALIPIATFFYERNVNSIEELSGDESRRIANWFIVVNMKGYYSSSTSSKLQKDLEIIRKRADGVFPYDELLNNVGERYGIKKSDIERGNHINVLRKQDMPYLFLLYVTLAKEGAEDLDGMLLSSKPYSELEKHHIFPKEILESGGITPDDPDEKEVFVSGLGNITFISKSTNVRILNTPQWNTYQNT